MSDARSEVKSPAVRLDAGVPSRQRQASMLIQVTEYLSIDLTAEKWVCHRCGHDLGSAHECYKKGCLVRARDPREIHQPLGPDKEFNFSFDPDWMMLLEFYCPQCATLVETEYLPPGHPLTWDIQIDLEALRQKFADNSAAGDTDP
jgi:acetone carboxylase gamma subunit